MRIAFSCFPSILRTIPLIYTRTVLTVAPLDDAFMQHLSNSIYASRLGQTQPCIMLQVQQRMLLPALSLQATWCLTLAQASAQPSLQHRSRRPLQAPHSLSQSRA